MQDFRGLIVCKTWDISEICNLLPSTFQWASICKCTEMDANLRLVWYGPAWKSESHTNTDCPGKCCEFVTSGTNLPSSTCPEMTDGWAFQIDAAANLCWSRSRGSCPTDRGSSDLTEISLKSHLARYEISRDLILSSAFWQPKYKKQATQAEKWVNGTTLESPVTLFCSQEDRSAAVDLLTLVMRAGGRAEGFMPCFNSMLVSAKQMKPVSTY